MLIHRILKSKKKVNIITLYQRGYTGNNVALVLVFLLVFINEKGCQQHKIPHFHKHRNNKITARALVHGKRVGNTNYIDVLQ